jgi:endonuclease YncB( thermonuclease family)
LSFVVTDDLKYLLCLFLLSFFLINPLYAVAADISGKARVVDGDTLYIGSTKIRLHGIDAPEMKQTCRTSKGKKQLCGQLAKHALQKLVKGHSVTCKGKTRDRYKRLIAVCTVGPFIINAEMVKRGWALAYRIYSKDYVDDEDDARNREVGMWQGEFMKPWEWRRK